MSDKTTSSKSTEKKGKLTDDEISAKVAELIQKYKNEISPISFETPDGEQIVGYCQEAEYDVIMYVGDCYKKGDLSLAAEAIVKNCAIVEECNPRVFSTERKDAKVRASFAQAALKLAIPYVDKQFDFVKKK